MYGVPKDKLVTYDQTTARLRLVKAAGGPIIELKAASGSPGGTRSYPKCAAYAQKGGDLLFFIFSAKMDYGFNAMKVMSRGQLWLGAVDVSRAGDPSYAPVWMPTQDSAQANHMGVWTTRIACVQDAGCGGGDVCRGGQCTSP